MEALKDQPVSRAAVRFGVPATTVQSWIDQGHLAAYRTDGGWMVYGNDIRTLFGQRPEGASWKDPLLTADDAAFRLKLAGAELDQLMQAGEVQPVRLPDGQLRFLGSEIERTALDAAVEAARPRALDRLLTPAEVAELFAVHPDRVGVWARAGLLHAIRSPGHERRFLEAEVLALRRQMTSTKTE